MTFVLTQDKVAYNQRVSVISAGVSIGCCVLVLVLALWVWSVRSARGFLHRVSFRLLLWSMFFEIIYDVNYIAVVMSASPTVINGRLDSAANARCATGIYFMIGTLGVVNYLCTAIAANLAITIVLGLNPIVLKLERWYVGISLFLGFFVPIVPAALGHFGFDPIFFVCWIQADDHKQRMINFVLDLYLWQLLSCLVATVCVAATLIKLFRQGRATSRALFEGNSINLEFSDDSWDHEEKPQPTSLVSRIFHRRRHSNDKAHRFGHLEDRFIRIALRISLYPVSLIIVNGIIAIGDLFISAQGGVHTETVYGLYRIYYFLYGARGIFFAMLGLFVDPCLPRGLKAAWKATFPGEPAPHSNFHSNFHSVEPKAPVAFDSSEPEGCITPNGTRIDPLAASTVTNGDSPDSPITTIVPKNPLERQTSENSMDMLHALLMSGPPEDHGHWTHEWHSASMTHDPVDDDNLRDSRHQRRSASLPMFSLPRFLRRGSRRAMSARSAISDEMNTTDDGPRFVEAIPEVELSPMSRTPPLPFISPSPIPSPKPEGFTMTFAGVAAGALPEGFDDHAHDVVHPEALEAARAAEAAAVEAAAAAAALARQKVPSTTGSRTPRTQGSRTPAVASLASGTTTPISPTPFGLPFGIRRSSLTSSMTSSNFPTRRGSTNDAPSENDRAGTRPGGSTRSSRIPPQRRATAHVLPRGSMDTSLTPIEERRQRRERALEIAERLYEEMEAQL